MRRLPHEEEKVMFSIGEIIDIAIQIEKNGESFYRKARENAADPGLKELLQWLADQELRHKESFLKMRASMSTKTDDPLIEQISGANLQAAVGRHAFSLEETDFSSLHDEKELLETALGFELDSIMFYEMILSLLADPVILGHAERIVEEERNHVELLRERQKSRKKPASAQ